MNKVVIFLYLVLLFSTSILSAQDSVSVATTDSSLSDIAKSKTLVVEESNDDFLILDDQEELLISKDLKTDETTDSVETSSLDTTSDTAIQVTQSVSSDSGADSSNNSLDKKEGSTNIVLENREVKPVDSVATSKKKGKSIVVVDGEKVNFAGNRDGYRSPKKAMLMSFLLPGLGQGYAKRPWKSVLFGAIEVGLIAGVAKSAYEGKQAKKEAENFANDHYSVNRFNSFYSKYLSYVESKIAKLNEEIESVNPSDVAKGLVVDNIYVGNDTTAFKGEIDQSLKTEMYEGWQYVQGWDDVEPSFDAIEGFTNIDTSMYTLYVHPSDTNADTTWFISLKGDNSGVSKLLGYSSNQNYYTSVVNRSQKYYGISQGFVILIALNHVVSAIDALITAKAYNDRLIRKESAWRHIHIDRTMAFSGTSGISAGVNLRVMF